ncbi:hypothetical protein ACF1G0_32755 [Streptomyces sp. NPDC013953]|uniref:hypothetical protein n=1 Tax=Streptomyces sp. NPDC013953 TaxID=3364868 RepID=UPI0036FCC61B
MRVPLPADDADAGRDVLTDIDVLSIDIDSRLRLSRSSLECKSGKGQSGEPGTILWLAGFRQLLDLDRVTLVRQVVSPRGQNLARKLGIVVMDEATVSRREKAHAWIPERFAHLDGPACSTAESRTDTQLKGLPGIPGGLARFLRGDALLADSPALLRAVESLGAAVVRQGVLPEPAAGVLASHALIAVLLAAIQDAGRLDDVPERVLRRRLEGALTVGDPDDGYVLAMLERADAFFRYVQERTHKAYVGAGAEPIRIDYPSLRDEMAAPPPYLNDYIDFVERLRANPQVARDLLQTAELVCFDALLGDGAWKEKAFAHLFTTEHKGLLLVALRCLSRIAGDQVAMPLRGIQNLPFEGSAGLVPDRSEPSGQRALFDATSPVKEPHQEEGR